jgi:hypothetical protein
MAFFKEFIGGFWGKLWISIASHGFSIWSWQNRNVLPIYTNPFYPIFYQIAPFVR